MDVVVVPCGHLTCTKTTSHSSGFCPWHRNLAPRHLAAVLAPAVQLSEEPTEIRVPPAELREGDAVLIGADEHIVVSARRRSDGDIEVVFGDDRDRQRHIFRGWYTDLRVLRYAGDGRSSADEMDEAAVVIVVSHFPAANRDRVLRIFHSLDAVRTPRDRLALQLEGTFGAGAAAVTAQELLALARGDRSPVEYLD